MRIHPHHTAVMLIDLQERIVPHMHERRTLVRRAGRLLQGANALELPILVTEQYPRGLGATVKEVAHHLDAAVAKDPKTRFSACSDAVMRHLGERQVRCVVLAGIETHICVLQTALDLIEAGLTVAVCLDATSSRREVDKDAAMRRLIQAGVLPTTVESVLFELLKDADHEKFRLVSKIVQSTDG